MHNFNQLSTIKPATCSATQDMHNEPVTADLTLFIDQSCFRDENGNHAGHTIAQLNDDGNLSPKLRHASFLNHVQLNWLKSWP